MGTKGATFIFKITLATVKYFNNSFTVYSGPRSVAQAPAET